MRALSYGLLLLAATVTGCASTTPTRATADVRDDVRARIGHDLRWDRQTKEDDEAKKAIDALLARELGVDAAVQIALLASPRVRALLEELAIGQADLVQAGLLSNPVFGFGKTAWDGEHIVPNLFASVEQSFLDVVTLPMKKRVAATELEATKLRVAFEVIDLAADVRRAYYEAQAAEQTAAVSTLLNEASQTAAELARRQHAAGNMNDLALSSELALAADQALALRRAVTDAAVARTELDKHMGVWGPRTAWKLPRRLPDLPPEEPSLEHLEARAVGERLDLAAGRRSLQALTSAISLAKTTRWFGKVDVAVEAGRLRETRRYSFGPSVALEIPLFDQRQGAIARLEAMARRTDDELQALAVDVRADVRAGRAKLVAARATVSDYTRTIIPLREDIVRYSQQQYDAMLLGVYQLLQARQAEFTAYTDSIAALRDYWIARSELERIVGSRLTPNNPR
ncbi:MAG: TolC family protein [Labilithrix sp.]|nr:TolC family protein [Labilithrix sp.]